MSILSIARPDPSVDAFRWGRAFPGRPEQASAVRRFVASLLDGCPIVDDVLLVVDELVVNALRHTRSGQAGGTFAVEIRRRCAEVEVAVADQGCATVPAPTVADELAESGRGLRTVSTLAKSWGWHGNSAGRTVSAVFDSKPAGDVQMPGKGLNGVSRRSSEAP